MTKFKRTLFSKEIEVIIEGEEEGKRLATGEVRYNADKKQLVLYLSDEIVEDDEDSIFTVTKTEPYSPLNWTLAIGQPLARFNAKKCDEIADKIDVEKVQEIYLANRSPDYRFREIAEAQEIWKYLP